MDTKAVPNGSSPVDDGRDPIYKFSRAVLELARLDSIARLHGSCPAIWGACVATCTSTLPLDLYSYGKILFGIMASMTAAHCAFCTFK
jgi:hypothetical protein